MQKNPLVSIIIPNFNTDKYLAETIESVLIQSYQNWELLIVDDHSTDNSRQIINRYCEQDQRIKFLQTEHNSGGPATPRNIGIENSSGDYIAFLDSDDVWYKDKLKFHLEFMQRENTNFSSTYRNTFRNAWEVEHEIKPSKYLKVYTFHELLKKNLIDTSAVIIAKELIGDIRFNPAKKLIAIEDYDFWLQVLQKHNERIIVSKTQTMNYRLTGANISRSKFKMARKFYYVVSLYEKSLLKRAYYFMNYSILSLIYQIKTR